jgi:hypothetical protein
MSYLNDDRRGGVRPWLYYELSLSNRLSRTFFPTSFHLTYPTSWEQSYLNFSIPLASLYFHLPFWNGFRDRDARENDNERGALREVI